MTNLQAIKFAAKVQIGNFIKANGMVMRVDKISNTHFIGQSVYKGKDQGLTRLSFEILLNPHYCKDIEILETI